MLRLDGVGDKTLDVVEEFWSSRPLSAFKESYDPILWTIGLGSSFLWMVFDFARNVYRVGKFVIPTRRLFANPPKEKPAPGQLVSVVGIVSSSDGEDPVRVKIREMGTVARGSMIWRETSRKSITRPFSLFVPTSSSSITVEPSESVELWSSATITEWKYRPKEKDYARWRNATLHDGDRIIVKGSLTEEIDTDVAASNYRVVKTQSMKRLVLRSPAKQPMIIASETLYVEVEKRAGRINWFLGMMVAFYVMALAYAVHAKYSEMTMKTASGIFFAYVFLRIGTMRDRLAWFDRPKPPKVHQIREHVNDPDQ